MHYKNGRIAANGDTIVTRDYNSNLQVGFLLETVPSSAHCNGTLIRPAGLPPISVDTKHCYHIEDAYNAIEAVGINDATSEAAAATSLPKPTGNGAAGAIIGLLLFGAILLCGLSASAQTATSAGVTLTAEQASQLDNSITTLIPLVPGKYQGLVAGGILLLTLASKLGRVIVGYKAGGWLGALKSVFTGSATAAKLLVCLALPAVLLFGAGCRSYQTINHQSGLGLHLILPVGYNGNNVFQMEMALGSFKNTQIVQPTGTNTLCAPGVVVLSTDGGTVSDNLTGNAGTGTNALAYGTGGAVVSGGDSDVITTGDAGLSVTNWSTMTTRAGVQWHGAGGLRGTNSASAK